MATEPIPIPFDWASSLAAQKRWGANCGPHAISSACNIPLEKLEGALHPFPGWMGPQHVERALGKINRNFIKAARLYTKEIHPGISRIQFRGPWLKPNQPPEEAYKHTHWVSCRRGHVHDTLFKEWLGIWVPIPEWKARMEAYAQKEYAGWHITHWYRILKTNHTS